MSRIILKIIYVKSKNIDMVVKNIYFAVKLVVGMEKLRIASVFDPFGGQCHCFVIRLWRINRAG